MAVKEIKSNLVQTLALAATISSNTTTVGSILDTANNPLGLMFGVQGSAYTDGSYVLLLEESDSADMSDAVPITGDKLVGELPVVSAATVAGTTLQTVGVISNLRYVRASIVSTSSSTGSTLTVISTEKASLAAVA